MSEAPAPSILFGVAAPQVDKKQKRKDNLNLSYYTEEYGLAIKPFFDEIAKQFAENASVLIKLTPANLGRGKLATAYVVFIRAGMYLADWMDTPDGKYATLRSSMMLSKNLTENVIEITKRPINSLGIKETQHDKLVIGDLESAERDEASSGTAWQAALDEFLETAESGQQLEVTQQNFGPDDMQHIRILVGALSQFTVVTLTKEVLCVARK